MAWQQAPFDPHRAVAILQDGVHRTSGYAVGAQLVLTCGHHLTGPLEVRPLRSDQASPARVEWRPAGGDPVVQAMADVVLLRCERLEDQPPVAFGLVERDLSTVEFEMYGWPLWSTLELDGKLHEAGRLIRGVIEPSDESHEGSLVLRPVRHSRAADSPWAGMSGAAVFVLDRLVGIQRLQRHADDGGEMEAVPVAPLMADPVFSRLASEAGITLDRRWGPTRSWPANHARIEVHGPARLPLMSPTRFQILADGCPAIRITLSGVRPDSFRNGVVPATHLVTVPTIVTSTDDLGRDGQLVVEATRGHQNDRAVHEFTVESPEDADLAFHFETVVHLLDQVRGGGPPSRNLRAAVLCTHATEKLRGAARLARSPRVGDVIIRGLVGVEATLSVERPKIERMLSDSEYEHSPEERQVSKYAYHGAYLARVSLTEDGLTAPARDRGRRERDDAALLLGFRDHAAFEEHIDPSLPTLLRSADPYVSGLLTLLCNGDVDIKHPDFTQAPPAVQAMTYDLVNALIRAGWARWTTGFNLTLTAVGQAGLRSVAKDV